MLERPILFSAPMVRALLDGSKVQTRRVVKFPIKCLDTGCELAGCELSHELVRRPELCRYGQAGDRLWVRETWGLHDQGFDTAEESSFPVYRADTDRPEPPRWRPSIHMPRWVSRISLEVTGVRVERAQSISEADALAEGVAKLYDQLPTARERFEWLWRSINGDESWTANPWVWVIQFKRIEQ